MTLRTLLLCLLIAGGLAARASEPILPPAGGASAAVTQPHVVAELIPESTSVQAGQPFEVALHLHHDEGWHTYWINPGDAGLATTITWTLPPGFTAGPIQWPAPEKHDMGGLMTYGYAGDVYLLTTITPPKSDLPQHFEIKAKASWLVCKEECIPGKAELTLPMDGGMLNLRLPVDNKDFFEQAKARLPVENTIWEVSGDYSVYGEVSDAAKSRPSNPRHVFEMGFESKAAKSPTNLTHVYFFPEQSNVFSPKDPEIPKNAGKNPSPDGFFLVLDLIQNGEMPDKLSGVLVSDNALIGSSKAVHIPNITVFNGWPTGTQPVAAAVPSGGSVQSNKGQLPVVSPQRDNPDNKLSGLPEGGPAPPLGTAAATTEAAPAQGPAPATLEGTAAQRAAATTAPDTTLIAVLGAAFVGGLILNLMPCVLPVLSLKVFSLMKHAGENPKAAWIQGVAFTAGVVLSFWVLAGLLIILRTAGNHLGWGFQMQSPGFVLGLILLFFLLGLNLFGVFELGASLVGLDAKATGHLGGLASSFGNGALATLAATPCTAPFMGSALGFAAQQPAYISLLIFTVLALGMASPYLLLTIFPGALRFVPKPGAWMEAFKQFMGFLLMATVIFLVYVFGALVGNLIIPYLLFMLLLWALMAWVYGRWGAHFLVVCLFMLLSFYSFVSMSGIIAASNQLRQSAAEAKADSEDGWQPWTQNAVDAALTKGQPVFVDFTAAWCLSCKVNERTSLETDAVRQAFAQKNVALFRADWTHSDPAISQTLQKFNRDGVPLYLLFSPKAKDAPQVLPAVLTPGIVLDALKNL